MVLRGIAPSNRVSARKKAGKYIIDSVLANPMKTFDKQQGHKHDHEPGVEFISKHCHGQERFRYCEPSSFA